MAAYECDDFRVSFEQVRPGSYVVTARNVDGREVRSTFALPIAFDRLEQAVLQLARLRSREVAPELVNAGRANAEELGAELGRALFDDTLGPFYDEARRSADANRRGVRLTLSLVSTPELLSVPWELLYRRPRFLASQRRSPIVRHLEIGEPASPPCIDRTVRVLGVVANPNGLAELDVAEERARVERALAPMRARGRVELDWCDPATPRSLREHLRDGTYHILHYVGHSDFHHGEGVLFLDDDAGGSAQVTESVLTNLLGDQTSLRLVVLNSCKGARTTLTDPFAGIATSLVALGVPAVIAMQFAISDAAAIAFSEELFTSLIGRQYPIDAAVAEARKAVLTEVNEIEWATPVLFMRSAGDGRLFDFAVEPAALPPPSPGAPAFAGAPPAAAATTGAAPTAEHRAVPAPDPPTFAAPTPTSPSTPSTPPSPSAPTAEPAPPAGRRRRHALIASGIVASLAIAAGVFASTGSDDGGGGGGDADESADDGGGEPLLQISPEAGPLGSTIEVFGDACPELPEGSVSSGIAYWLVEDAEGRMIASGDLEDASQGSWSASLELPGDEDPEASFVVGASCWSTDAEDTSANYFEYSSVAFEVTDSGS